MLSFLLHAANRNIKSEDKEFIDAFYKIKDAILKKYGAIDGYDIQHIKGKRCNSCDGHGRHWKYSYTTGKRYDYTDCWHCWGGWYKLPKWIALHRIKFGKFIFHRPLKRHECVGNPFSPEELGWNVTDRPVIQGYIDHDNHWFGEYAMLLLFMIYNYPIFRVLFEKKWYWKKIIIRNWFRKKLHWSGWILHRPSIFIRQYYNEDFTHSEDLPF